MAGVAAAPVSACARAHPAPRAARRHGHDRLVPGGVLEGSTVTRGAIAAPPGNARTRSRLIAEPGVARAARRHGCDSHPLSWSPTPSQCLTILVIHDGHLQLLPPSGASSGLITRAATESSQPRAPSAHQGGDAGGRVIGTLERGCSGRSKTPEVFAARACSRVCRNRHRRRAARRGGWRGQLRAAAQPEGHASSGSSPARRAPGLTVNLTTTTSTCDRMSRFGLLHERNLGAYVERAREEGIGELGLPSTHRWRHPGLS